jgi:hypothetical protein
MVSWTRLALAAALLLLVLSLVPWPAQAGTADDPDIEDASGDQEVNGVVPTDPVIGSSADIVAAWITEESDALIVTIELAGTAAAGTLGDYSWSFVATVNGAEIVASADSDGTPGGVASAAKLDGSLVVITVPREALAGAVLLEGIHARSAGGSPATQVAIADTAPDDGADAGLSYSVQGGTAAGALGDADGDGLNDTWEVKHFGNATKQNGTGDPDGDGLNNTREQTLGTDPSKPDTDGDFLNDGNDTAPLDATKPADSDKDGLTDSWEREHFTAINAQNGTGDPDHDRLTNAEELALGTDPNKADTDGDGATDDDDSDPLDPDSGASEEAGDRDVKPELYGGAALFALAATFILLGLAKGI